jgi:hypothetical protein
MKMNRTTAIARVRTAAALFAIVSLCGCASIVDGGRPKISINSSPEGAKVTIFDKKDIAVTNGVTPFVASLKRSRGYFVGAQYKLVFELAGHQKAEAMITSKVNGWYIGNIFFGGLLGMLIVDPATGAMWSLHPKMIEQPLDKEQTTLLREGKAFFVVLKEQATPNELRAMQPIHLNP